MSITKCCDFQLKVKTFTSISLGAMPLQNYLVNVFVNYNNITRKDEAAKIVGKKSKSKLTIIR